MGVPMKKILPLVIALCFLATAAAAIAQRSKAPRLTTVTEERYRLQPGDVFEVQFRYSHEFNQTVTVQPDGYISLEMGGDLKVAGLTIEQTREAILKKAGARLQDPVAAIVLKEFQKPYFVISGEVNLPGKIGMRDRVTALPAIILARGKEYCGAASHGVRVRPANSRT